MTVSSGNREPTVDRNAEETLELRLAGFKRGLLTEIDLAALHSRNPVAHKWKAPFRSLLLRECVAWRTHDLLEQSLLLNRAQGILGARVLLRSALETVAVLIYLNQLMNDVLNQKMAWESFGEKTTQLLIGTRDGSTDVTAINIITVFEKCDRRYPGIEAMYGTLSESAHPNHAGLTLGYCQFDIPRDLAQFSNRWVGLFSRGHIESLIFCLELFTAEYNDVWTRSFELLEAWLADNDVRLEEARAER